MAKAQARADAMIAEAEAKGRAAQREAARYMPRGASVGTGAAPPALPARPVLPFHAEILDWEAAAAWVAPDRNGPPRVPSRCRTSRTAGRS